jgi:stage IV sporulation protein FB
MLHLGSVGKTSIDVDFSFFILLGLFVILNYDESKPIEYALIWIPILFVSVLIHELAHAAAIALFGFGASDIVLGGMGGYTANAHRHGARPWQGVLISVAGPMASFALMILCLVLMYTRVGQTDKMLQVFLPMSWWANKWWGIFNLIPIKPLDGGNAMRDFFRMFLTERNAFVVATWIALIVGVLVAIYGFARGQMFLGVYIAWFTYLAFQQWQYFRQHGTPGD